jgi:hypothetical protein
MPEKRELVTQLTISESELEEELKLHLEPEKSGLQRFVTAPTTFNEEKVLSEFFVIIFEIYLFTIQIICSLVLLSYQEDFHIVLMI